VEITASNIGRDASELLPNIDVVTMAQTSQVLGEGSRSSLSAFDYLIRH
jgi:alkyl hydroperoxide reductase subunit AhpF